MRKGLTQIMVVETSSFPYRFSQLLATLTRSKSNRERRGAAPCCHRRTTSESFWSRSDSGPHSWA